MWWQHRQTRPAGLPLSPEDWDLTDEVLNPDGLPLPGEPPSPFPFPASPHKETLLDRILKLLRDKTLDWAESGLEFIAKLLEGLENTKFGGEFKGHLKIKVCLPGVCEGEVEGEGKLWFETTGADAAEMARRLADQIKEWRKKSTSQPTIQAGVDCELNRWSMEHPVVATSGGL